MIAEHDEDKIRRIIDNLIVDGSTRHLNELAQVLLKRDADANFFQDLCGRLSGKGISASQKLRDMTT